MTTPYNDDSRIADTDDTARTTDAAADRDYADDRTAGLDADRAYTDDRTADATADRDYADNRSTDVTGDRDSADNRSTDVTGDRDSADNRSTDVTGDRDSADDDAVRTTDRGEVDPTSTDETDRSAYADSDRLDDSGDALGRPTADPVGEQRSTDNAPEVSPDDPLVPDDMVVDFKARWDVIQQGFVDDPRNAVTDADKLVGDVLERLSSTFAQQHQSLEGQWSDGEPSTEDLRGALQRYRAFFDRLLTL
ncbi:hypothetical protein [Kribbella sp. NPDC006257]|uniref:hypothetical protein n=1 Tax=Kribbella sp. NPDC006257 TaxID=3156738 RepID=UPI0033AFD22E